MCSHTNKELKNSLGDSLCAKLDEHLISEPHLWKVWAWRKMCSLCLCHGQGWQCATCCVHPLGTKSARVKSSCSIRTRFTDLFKCLIFLPLFPYSPSNISLSTETSVPLARGMRRGHCTKNWTNFFSALPSAPWTTLGASGGKIASLPAAWGQHFCMLSCDLLVNSTSSALDLFHQLLMMTLKDWKETASASLVGHWHTGELRLFSSIRCLWPVSPTWLHCRAEGGWRAWVEAGRLCALDGGPCLNGRSVLMGWCTCV